MSFFGQWVAPPKAPEVEGVEPDPVEMSHQTAIRKTDYKGPPPLTYEQIEEYRSTCNVNCEVHDKGSIEWSKCANACAREAYDLTKGAMKIRQKMQTAEARHFSRNQGHEN